jgi:hypothetical protein
MIIVRLRGGLGNQMFQYAFAQQLSHQLGVDFKLDLSSLLKRSKKRGTTNRDYQLDIFNIQPEFLVSKNLTDALYSKGFGIALQGIKAVKLAGFKKVKERQFRFDPEILRNSSDKNLYTGYWQSAMYFPHVVNQLRKDFTFRGELSTEATTIHSRIQSSEAVCVHVRRGDYVGNTSFNSSGNDYFKKSAMEIGTRVTDPKFFIFSDEPEWCQENLDIGYPFVIVDYQTPNPKFKEDLWLMSSCRHFIMSASSFSWWAVWLSNQSDQVVTVPDPWFLNDFADSSDLVDAKWIKVS